MPHFLIIIMCLNVSDSRSEGNSSCSHNKAVKQLMNHMSMTGYVTRFKQLKLSGSQTPQGGGSTRLEICNWMALPTSEHSKRYEKVGSQ